MRMRLRILGVFLLALACSDRLTAARAQERFGGISGTVTDANRARCPAPPSPSRTKTTGASRTVVSGSDGGFRIPDLDPGRYTVTVELQGFQKLEADDILILLGRMVTFPASLQVGSVTEVVNVTADTLKQVDIKTVTIAHNVTSEEFDRMPKARSSRTLR